MAAISEIQQPVQIQELNVVGNPEITQTNLDLPNIDNVLLEPAKDTDFIGNTAEKNNDITATPINDIQCTESQELLDKTEQKDPTSAKDITPRSRSQSPNKSQVPTKIVAVNLFPLTDSITFSPKHLTFMPDQEIKIGRVSGSRNQKEAKAENGVFICDVMSREHAMLKEANGKILIKDTRSTHGTFVNSVRLGDGTQDSEWKELKHGDVITFGHSVRRNQSLYKHLSAYVFYPKEQKELPPIPVSTNGTSSFSRDLAQDLMMPTSQHQNYQAEKPEDRIPTVSSTNITNNPSKETTTTDNLVPITSPIPMKIEDIPKDHKPTNSVAPLLPRTSAVSNLRTNDVSSTSVVKPKSPIPITKQDRRPAPLDNITRFEVVAPVKEEIISPEDFPMGNTEQITHQVPLVPPVPPPPFEATESVASSMLVNEKGTQTYRELKHSKVLRNDNKDNMEISEEFVPMNNNNGEGSSYMNETIKVTTTSTTTTTTARKRKHEEIEGKGEAKKEEIKELEEKVAVLERYANKRTKRETFRSVMIGMVAGIVGIGFGAYLLGN